MPLLGSLILTHDLERHGPRPEGMAARRARRRWSIPFFAFRIMVGIGLLMLALVVAGNADAPRRPAVRQPDWFLRACELAAPLGFLAVLAGWTTTEVGRQPWTVYGLLRTAEFGVAVADRHRRR